MKKLLLITLAIVTTITHVSIAESNLPVHEVKVAKVEKVDAIADMGLIGIEKILNGKQYTHEFLTYDSLNVNKEEFWNLVYIVSTEARGESNKGQQLVMNVILNRVGDERFADNIINVIEQPSQFCGRWVSNWGYYTKENVDNVIEVLYNRSVGNITEVESKVKFFHNHNTVSTRGYAARFGLTKLEVEGNHTFLDYKGE